MSDESGFQNGQITEMLRAWSEGSGEAMDEILPFGYDELHRFILYKPHSLPQIALTIRKIL